MSGQFRASILWRALKSPSPQPPEAQPLVFSHGAVLPSSFLWMGCGWRGWSVPTRGALCHVQYTHPSEDAQAGLERLHRAISPWPGPAEPWNGLFPQLAPTSLPPGHPRKGVGTGLWHPVPCPFSGR